ncbi:MAG: ribonuclease P protein component [Alphaproteobacteria bacterium]|nr:ribonuclease P protein component [Alphaproteobacteria bacterium]
MLQNKISTITKRSDFIYLKKHGTKIRSRLLNLIYAKSTQDVTKVAYIASKKIVGKAVKRNKSKRRLRSLVMEYCTLIPNNYLLLFIASSKTYNIDYQLLTNDFLYCINKINNLSR